MKTVSLKLPEPLAGRLTAEARRTGLSKSGLLRAALREYLESHQAEGSFLDRARDLAGCVEAPADLSTNEDYLRGYGR